MRYYYKSKSGKGFLNLKSKLSKKEMADYVEITEEQFNALTARPEHEPDPKAAAKKEIASLKKHLADTDYCIIKIAEGAATAEEYAAVIADRASWRARINELEATL